MWIFRGMERTKEVAMKKEEGDERGGGERGYVNYPSVEMSITPL